MLLIYMVIYILNRNRMGIKAKGSRLAAFIKKEKLTDLEDCLLQGAINFQRPRVGLIVSLGRNQLHQLG